ncbi:LINE-1 retrotransposable element ORF1 protein [Anabarilius grahami]|uniref:Conserved oligomeric Golgi complex subunit 6 n=1 Tax=Anabarilius grahami TaxID=495550 RepID=A0A3N0YFH8_ANAGA|nr:LINE-1 retrotransposable element ORF1 protein [Anabarilius grahami]
MVQRMRMAKCQLTLASPEKKRAKDPNVPEGELRAIVADELKLHLSFVRELFKEEFAPIADRLGVLEEDVRLIRNNFDNMQAALRNAKKDTVEIEVVVNSLQEKLARIEDKSRQSNVRLVGLKEGVEGDDPLRFIQNHLPKWIPSLAGKVLEIERAHRIYSGERAKSTPRTFIFKMLRYQDRNVILNGARGVGQILHNGSPLLFFPDYSNQTASKRRSMALARKKLTQLGVTSFLLYPAVVKVTHRGKVSL